MFKLASNLKTAIQKASKLLTMITLKHAFCKQPMVLKIRESLSASKKPFLALNARRCSHLKIESLTSILNKQ